MGTYTYPNYPKQLICKDANYGIGDYYESFPDANISPYNFRSVIDLDLSDYNSTYTQENPYTKKILELKNGYKLMLSMVPILSPRLGISFAAYWLDENDEGINLQGIASTFSAIVYYDDDYRTSFYDDLGKLVFLAIYPTNTIPEVSETTYFDISILFKSHLNRYIGLDLVDLENDLGPVYENNSTQRQYIFAVDYESTRYRVEPAAFRMVSINFDSFAAYIKGHGTPFEGDVFDPEEPDKPPAGGGDNSGPGGGGGNYDDTSDPIDFPDLPTGGAINSGAIHAHLISAQSLQTIMGKLWSNSIFDIMTTWQKSIQDPMDAVVSLHALPVIPSITTAKNVLIGNFDTEVPTPVINSQYVEVDCGQITIKEYWGSALDYSPYTEFEIFLPFIGIKTLKIEDVMKSTIHIKYHVDILTGELICFIKCGQSVLYHYNGNCKMTIPLTSKSTDALQKTLLSAGAMGAGLINPAASGATLAGMAISSAANVAASKTRTSRSGDISGAVSLMDDFVPYVIIHRPVQSLARDYNKFKGYPSNITYTLDSLNGYTEVEHVHLTGIKATDTELQEIEDLLKSGVII